MAEEEPHLHIKWKWLGLEGSARGSLAISVLCGLALVCLLLVAAGNPIMLVQQVVQKGSSAFITNEQLRVLTSK